MPDHFWKCELCGVENPPFTEICRNCDKPALGEKPIDCPNDTAFISETKPTQQSTNKGDVEISPRKTIKEKSFLLAKWAFYFASFLGFGGLLLFALYVKFVDIKYGLALGFLIAAVLMMWAIIAIITLPIMAICWNGQKANLKNIHIFFGMVITIFGIGLGYVNGQNFCIQLKTWPPFSWQYFLTTLSAAAIGGLSVACGIMMIFRKPQAINLLRAIFFIVIANITLGLVLQGISGKLHFSLSSSDGLKLLPLAIYISIYAVLQKMKFG